MGETKLQKNIFTLMMCIGMVSGMTIYNIILRHGFSGDIFTLLIKQVWGVFFVALVLDVFLVGPIAKKQVFSRVKADTKKGVVILCVSLSMVISMVLIMSLISTLFIHGFTTEVLKAYPHTVLMNFIAALPLNLLIVSPLARGLHLRIFPPLAY